MLLRRDILKLGAMAVFSAAGGMLLPGRVAAGDGPIQHFKFPEPNTLGHPDIEDPPQRIVERGLIRCGLFNSPVQDMNLLESNALEGRARNRLGLPRLMEWVGAGMVHPDWYFGFIIVNAQAASLGVLYGYCRRNGAYFSHDCFGPKGRVRVAGSTWNDTTSINKRGFDMNVRHRLDCGFHKVKIGIRGSGKKPSISADLVWHEDLSKTRPLVLMAPLRGNGFMYNHKAPMPIEGTMKIGDEEIAFDPRRDLAILDDLKTFGGKGAKPRYKWSNFGGVGFDATGRVVGLNSARTPDKPDPYWDENYIWAGNSLSKIGPVFFDIDPGEVTKPWRIHDQEGRVNIDFYPEGGKTVSIAGLAAYYQKCGRFSGTLIDSSGERHKVNDFYGAGEYADIF